jgi:hypothetical protein
VLNLASVANSHRDPPARSGRNGGHRHAEVRLRARSTIRGRLIAVNGSAEPREATSAAARRRKPAPPRERSTQECSDRRDPPLPYCRGNRGVPAMVHAVPGFPRLGHGPRIVVAASWPRLRWPRGRAPLWPPVRPHLALGVDVTATVTARGAVTEEVAVPTWPQRSWPEVWRPPCCGRSLVCGQRRPDVARKRGGRPRRGRLGRRPTPPSFRIARM